MNYFNTFVKHNKITILITVVVLLLIMTAILFLKNSNKEKFADLPLAADKMLMVTDTNGNIETLPLSSLHNYLKSIETDINSFKSNTTGVISNMQTNVDTQIKAATLDKDALNRSIAQLQNEITTFKNSINEEVSGIQLNLFSQTGGSTQNVDKLKEDLAKLTTDTSVFQVQMVNRLDNLKTEVNTNKSSISTQSTSISSLTNNFNAFKSAVNTKLDEIKNNYLKKGTIYDMLLGSNFKTTFKV